MGSIYKRVILKLSGEALAGEDVHGINAVTLGEICRAVKDSVDCGVQIGIVVGGGNFWRGRTSDNMDQTRADHIGMLATAMNALAVSSALDKLGVATRVQTAIEMTRIAEPYIRARAIRHFEKGRVLIFGCGTGNPYFTTDSAAALRAAEIGADIILKATVVDGVYDSDPNKNPDAKKYDTITLSEVIEKDLKVMDGAAAAICRDNKIPILVFSIRDPQNLVRVINGEKIGTLVTACDK